MPSTAIASQVLDTTLTLMALYPYFDVVSSSPEPHFPSKLNIKDRIEAIRSNLTVYKTERAFHEEISKIYVELRDAHSSYSHCFSGFTWVQPWSIVADYPNALLERNATELTKPRLSLNSLVTDNFLSRSRPLEIASFVSAFLNSLGFDPKTYINATILEIDGQNVVDFVSNLASISNAFVKDDNARFNAIVSKSVFLYGKFVLQDGILSRQTFVPAKETRDYKLQFQNGTTTTLSVPWFMLQPRLIISTYTSRQEFYQLFCLRSEVPKGSYIVSNSTANFDQHNRRDDSPEMYQRELDPDFLSEDWNNPYLPDANSTLSRIVAKGQKLDKNLKLSVSNSNRISGDNYTSFYILPDGKTAVWVFPTVSPSGITLSDGSRLSATSTEVENWLDNIALGFATLQRNGYTKLIIDVSSNGGGVVCYAQLIATILFNVVPRKLLFKDIQFPVFDMRSSDLLNTIAKASASTASSKTILQFYSSATKSPLQNPLSVWYTTRSPGPDNTKGAYTQQYGDTFCNIPSLVSSYVTAAKLQQSFWDPSNIALLSDGVCGSACSFITRALVEQKKIRSYVYGGLTDNGKNNVANGVAYTAFPWCGFDGGPVASEIQIRREIALYQAKLPQAIGTVVPGSAASWTNLVAANTLSLLPIAVNWSLPISATYGATKLNLMTEWTYEIATEVANVLNSFEDRPSLWAEVADRLGKPVRQAQLYETNNNSNLSSSTGSGKSSNVCIYD
ncbi:hypothetical protein HK096_002311 [Nowakowskiella sp. JEL0078]|nr:hypothetical protein HK096_002311 [Nowakowskiella sp. JEL0078]